MTARLTFGVDGDGHLVISPPRGRHLVSVRLRADGAELLYGELAPVRLPWDDYGRIRWVMDGPPSDGWAFTDYSQSRSGYLGVAVRVSGRYDEAARAIYRATMRSLWRRYVGWFGSGGATGRRVPLLAQNGALTGVNPPELSTLVALATVASRRKEVRSAFSDPARMQRLAADLTRGCLRTPVFRTGFRRDSVDIITAMHRAGLVHAFGRPLGDKPLPNLDDAVTRTRDRLNANPFRKGRVADDTEIEALVRSEFLDVQPWPFAALFD